jgi:hypothetical protein
MRDDQLLLRAVAFGAGHFDSVGWSITTSTDGTQWSDHPVSNLGGALACHDSTCVAITGASAFHSADHGATWSPAALDAGQALIGVTWGPW